MKPRPEPESRPTAAPRQTNLFSGEYEPLRVVPRAPAVRKNVPPKPPSHLKSGRPDPSDQQRLLAFPVTPRPNESAGGIPLQTRIYCNAPVAGAAHRLVACGLDASILIIAYGIFLIVFYLAGGEIVKNPATLPYFGAAAVALLLLYRVLWCLANSDSIGMRWCGLRLVTFDGVEPRRSQRFHRALVAFVSAMPAGLGLIWALADEEKLTWHDHITRTFPTPRRNRAKHPGR